MASGIEKIPLWFPDEAPEWFRLWLQEFLKVLAKADIRNATGVGVDISGSSNDPATISTSDDVTQLFDADFVLAEANALLPNARTFEVESGVLGLTDSGPGGTLNISVTVNGVGLDKLSQIPPTSVLANPTGSPGDVQTLYATTDNTALVRAGGVLTWSAFPVGANPSASIGLTAVNGAALTFLRSDSAQALDVGISPTWSGTHTFSNTPVVPNDSWTYAKIQNVSATARILGRITSGAGDIEELSGTQATTLLDSFTSSLKGLAPASGGGTSNYLRADGTWAAPPGSGGVSGANPTASVGLSAVNGAASTYLRSDGAPALDQSIVPTWSGQHTFSVELLAPVGSNTSPAYSFSSDPDTGMYSGGANILRFATNGVSRFVIGTGGAAQFTSSVEANAFELAAGGSVTNGIILQSGGDVRFNSGGSLAFTLVNSGSLHRATFSGPARLKSYTVSTLPGSPLEGDTAYVTDALAPTFLAALVGGGSIKTPVFYNGSAWVSY